MDIGSDKILLTGVCYVHRLLQLRFSNEGHSYIRDVHPKFEIGNIDFFRDDIAQRFLFTDFHGKFSSLETEAKDLRQLLQLYSDRCQLMYVVGATGIANIDLATVLSPADYRRLSVFWYFLFDERWNPNRVRAWADMRDQALLSLLIEFPKLRFVFYQPECVEWWQAKGLPGDRLIYWNIDWGMSRQQFEEIRQTFLAQKRHGAAHRFPTEQSYNELCALILADSQRTRPLKQLSGAVGSLSLEYKTA